MITVTILTKNSEKYLKEVLESLIDFDDVLILDSGSTDSTLELAAGFKNVTIHKRASFDGFGFMHNLASSLAKNEWIFSLDSDEVPTQELLQELKEISLDTKSVYFMPRKNYYQGKWIRGCGWYPDHVCRIYHRQKTQFSDAMVHESVQRENMNEVYLKGPIKHYSYDSTEEFLHKMQVYSELFATQYAGKRSSSLSKAITRAAFTFFKSYFLQKGFLDGQEGFVISVYNANTTFYKYLKLKEKST
jgi:glycosyltransferase involved in cell wall biosynthesis